VRDEHRNVLLPLFDGTHRVTNPLTGDQVVKHPQCFVIMSGNRGLQFTGTYAIDPALLTRSLTWEFDYIAADDEERITREASGCDEEMAKLFVRFANETRVKAKQDVDFAPISTREVISAAKLVAMGVTPDIAAQVVVMYSASAEGGPESIRAKLESIWTGIRKPAPVAAAECGAKYPYNPDYVCDLKPGHAGLHNGKCPELDWQGKIQRETWS
jgi:MoxR-like ATPase